MNPRHLALQTIDRTLHGNSLDSSIEKCIASEKLSPADFSLAVNISMGVIQNYRLLDYVISEYTSKGLSRLHPKVKIILEIGVYQLLYLDRIPEWSVIDESVKLSRVCGQSYASGLINAILRKIASSKHTVLEQIDSISDIGIRYNHPDWLVSHIALQNNRDFAREYASANAEKPDICLFVNTMKTDVSSFSALLKRNNIPYSKSRFFDDCLHIRSTKIDDIPGYSDGLFYIQDEAAHFVSAICPKLSSPSIYDACSAPGGKAISSYLKYLGKCSMISADVSDVKVEAIRNNITRMGLTDIDCLVADASEYNPAFLEQFDIILADVPCSGTGIIRRHPDIRLKKEDCLIDLAIKQKSILSNVSKYVKKGGYLVYSTCSVLKDENDLVIESFLKDNSDFISVDFKCSCISSKNGMYTFWPCIDGTDGFFIALLQRK